MRKPGSVLLEIEGVDVDADHAGNALQHGVDVAQVDRLGEIAALERQVVEQRGARGGEHVGRDVTVVDDQGRGHQHGDRRVVVDQQPVVGIALGGERGRDAVQSGRRERPATLRRDGEVDRAPFAVPHPGRLRLGDLAPIRIASSKSMSEIARPNVRTVPGAASRARVIVSGSAPPSAAIGLVAFFTPVGRSSRLVSLPAPDAAREADSLPVGRDDVLPPGRSARAGRAVAELDRQRPVVGEAGREDLIGRRRAVQRSAPRSTSRR